MIRDGFASSPGPAPRSENPPGGGPGEGPSDGRYAADLARALARARIALRPGVLIRAGSKQSSRAALRFVTVAFLADRRLSAPMHPVYKAGMSGMRAATSQ